MDKFKVKLDQPEMSDADILKHKDFGNVVKAVGKTHVPWYKSGKFLGLGGGGIAVIAISTTIWMNSNSHERKPTDNLMATTQVVEHELAASTLTKNYFKDTRPFESFEIDPTVDNEIITNNQSIIMIAANSLVNSHGEPASGKVSLSFTDYYNPLQIMLAGIEMDITENNNREHLESNGMFELEIGDGCQIDADKPLTVHFKTLSQSDEYGQYAFDNGQWKQIADNTPTVLVDETAETGSGHTPEEVKLVKPVLEEDESVLKTLKPKEIAQFPELKGYKNVCLKLPVKDRNLADPHLIVTDGQVIRSGKPGIYKITLTVRGKTFTSEGPIAFSKEHHAAAMEVFRTQEKRLKRKQKENNAEVVQHASHWNQQKLSSQAKLILQNSNGVHQTFTVINAGVYNSDRILKQKPQEFKVEYASKLDRQKVIKVYSLIPEINTVLASLPEEDMLAQSDDKSIIVFVCEDDQMSVSYLKDIKIGNKKVQFPANQLINKVKGQALLSSMVSASS